MCACARACWAGRLAGARGAASALADRLPSSPAQPRPTPCRALPPGKCLINFEGWDPIKNQKKDLKYADVAQVGAPGDSGRVVSQRAGLGTKQTALSSPGCSQLVPLRALRAPRRQDAEQGSRTLQVSCCVSRLEPGRLVRLLMSDPGDGSLIAELNNGLAPVPERQKGERRAHLVLARTAPPRGSLQGGPWPRRCFHQPHLR
jgi:hypothetical protein